MMITRLLSFFLILAIQFINGLYSLEDKEIEVIPNPHDHACSSNLESLLEPYHLITKPLHTQRDTFLELIYRKILSVPIPIYRMKQPLRISTAELEFSLILVKDLTKSGKTQIQEMPVDRDSSLDSWFIGYSWTPLAMGCGNVEGGYQHVGWKFTAIGGEGQQQALSCFYALMVNYHDKEGGLENMIRIGGFRIPGRTTVS